MADAATCKVCTIMHATVQAGTAFTGCKGYCTMKAITDLLLLLLLLTNLRVVLELIKALHLEKGTFTEVLERKSSIVKNKSPIRRQVLKVSIKSDGRS